MSALTSNDNRSAKRYDLRIKLSYCDPVTKHHVETLTTNISKRGLRFLLPKKLQKGDILDLKIEDPYGKTTIISKAKIMWVKESRSGGYEEDTAYETGVSLIKKTIY
ncbi:MAG: PilZ domain-containing protein [Candidatus Omnitrophica bacterium]|nr:PilZ domain-containing protein [Candidatus Omnitrophota bacterium]